MPETIYVNNRNVVKLSFVNKQRQEWLRKLHDVYSLVNIVIYRVLQKSINTYTEQ